MNEAQEIAGLLDCLLTSCENLYEVLLQEQKVLGGYDIEAFNAISLQKQDLVSRLSDAEKQLMVGLRIDPKISLNTQVDNYIALHPEIKPIWEKLRGLLRQCHEQNSLNGIVVRASLQRTRRMLDFLLPKQNAGTYNVRGDLE